MSMIQVKEIPVVEERSILHHHNGRHRAVEAEALAAELQRTVRGEVLFDVGSRALYATDASNYRQPPIGVVRPRDKEDVIATVAACQRHGAPVLARGGGTSLAGQCCNVAVLMDMSRYMNRVLNIMPEQRLAQVQPGLVLDELRHAAAAYQLTFGPDPATHTHCTLGGMIGNNSCGVHSQMAGKTVDNVEALDILTYDGLRLHVGRTEEAELEQIIAAGGQRGQIYGQLKALRDEYADLIRQRFPDIPRRVSGYNLNQLLPENGFHVARALVGTECTCVTILEATVNLVDRPKAHSLLVLGYEDVFAAADHVPQILEFAPIGLEGIDDRLIGYMRKKELHPSDIGLLLEGGGWLLVEFGGESHEDANARVHEVMAALEKSKNPPTMKLFGQDEQEERLWTIRESGLGATANVPGLNDTWPGWEDAAVHPERLEDYLRDFRHLHDEHAQRLSQQTFTLSEFLMNQAAGYEPPPLHRKAVVHGHCHHKAIMRLHGEAALLQAMACDHRTLESGCCGMAGSFGFEKGERYEVSIQAGERMLLPAVREADPDTLIISNGFSCREQIAQTTNRRALHIAEVLQMALHEGNGNPEQEKLAAEPYTNGWGAAAILAGGLFAGGTLLWQFIKARRE